MEFPSHYSDSEIALMMRERLRRRIRPDITSVSYPEQSWKACALKDGYADALVHDAGPYGSPQAVSWMALGKGPHEYSKAILLTPEVVEKNGIYIFEYDSNVIDRWYPADA
jgi:hypothetical protein